MKEMERKACDADVAVQVKWGQLSLGVILLCGGVGSLELIRSRFD